MSKRAKSKEFYISIDGEANGPLPGVNSLLQFGAVFYDPDGKIVAEQLSNLEEIPGGVADQKTMNWWAEQEAKFPGIWDRMRTDLVSPKAAMNQFQATVSRLCKELDALPVTVAYPAGYDFTWLYWYMYHYLGMSPVSFSCLDMKTLAMSLLGTSYRGATKRNFPKQWFAKDLPHTHNALDDAREQGHIFFRMMEELARRFTPVVAG